MLKEGAIDKTGKLKTQNAPMTQNDIRRIQTAKAAIRAGMDALLKRARLALKDLSALYVAGKFGNFIDKHAAMQMGLLPDMDSRKIKFIGNAAYKGAVMALCSLDAMKKSKEIANQAVHVSLFGLKDFKEEFIKHMRF